MKPSMTFLASVPASAAFLLVVVGGLWAWIGFVARRSAGRARRALFQGELERGVAQEPQYHAQ